MLNTQLYLARAELRRAGDVSPLILREAHHQGIDIPRSPKPDLNFDRSQNNILCVLTEIHAQTLLV